MANNNEVAKTDAQAPAAAEPPKANEGLVKASAKLENHCWTCRKMVLQYSARIVGEERAREFATHVAIMARQESKINNCDPVSILKGMMACVRIDMMPNTPEQYVALISPMAVSCSFQVMYRGLTQLAYNSGIVKQN
jgi:recombinational DNA repair protein RecT